MYHIDAQSLAGRPAIPTLLRMVELSLFLICSLILTGAPIDFLVKSAGIVPTSGLGIFWIPLLVMAVVGLIFYPGKIISASWVSLPVVLLASAVALSCLWSLDRATSVKDTLFFLASIAGAFYLAKRFHLREILNVLALMFGGLAVVSIVLALGLPNIGVMHDAHAGAWSGPWIDKNTLGRFFVLGFSVAMGRWGENPHSWPTNLPLALISIALVLMSTSKTSLVGLIMVLVIVVGVFILRRGPLVAVIFAWSGAIMTALVMAIMVFAPGVVFGLLHRDATLTSRTQIWAATERLIEKRPVKGYGFGAVWSQTSASAPVVAVHQELDFKPVNAHSSWKDARLQTGLFGLFALSLMMIFALGRALWSIPWSKSAYWTLPSLAMLLQTSLVESVLVNPHGTESFLFILLTVIAAGSRRMRVAKPAPNPVHRTVSEVFPLPQYAPSALLAQRLYRMTHPVINQGDFR